ncbi:MAG: LysR family transcriptional regulator [Fretibacterium sp.]|nr:LysR family transcriptional regulator [Fretibacterium sp.]
MNILHMAYAVKVADAGSLNKASDELLIAPPNLSRSIKELESDLGITLFERSPRGMSLTPRGEDFIHYAKKILCQIDDLEKVFKENLPKKQKFSISVPRASYIAEAFVRFSKRIGSDEIELYYKETNSYRAVKNILNAGYKLGIIRYAACYDKYFQEMLKEKNLVCDILAEFRYVLIMSRKSPLAAKAEIHFSDLHPLTEIAHADPFVPSLPLSAVMKEELPDDIKRHIFVFERASQFDLLADNPQTFMWVSPVPDKLLHRYELVQKKCPDNSRTYQDVLIYRKGYTLSELDRQFIAEVRASKRECL